ncbi:MAG: serine--tRNA ligase [Candidatus Nomurabacteria bacterium]|jgi:seryl-tRNA synthetase|nr:serine--tRNA ligase [Candidatus Nomurabacteria bacterium]
MMDIKYIRDNAEKVQQNNVNKGYGNLSVEELLDLDNERRDLQTQVDELREQRNQISAQMKNGKPDQDLIDQGKQIKIQLSEREEYLRATDEKFMELLKKFPNMALDSVPVGLTEDENVEVKRVGDQPKFDFTPLNHAELAIKRGWLDQERAVKVAGSRFVYMKGDLARLEFAMFQFGIDTLTDPEKIREIIEGAGLTGKVSEIPFTFVLPPAVAKTAVFEATGRLNRAETTYKIEDEDLWLNASAEHTLSPMYLDEILDEKDLPIRLVGYTTAFRREAGTYGKDTEGFFRLHQFNKLEMESFTTADKSYNEHLFMVAIQEYLMAQLKLPYRVLEKCTFDIGRPNAKGVDIEVWLPSQNKYRETHTADYITDFQTRAMKTRVRRENGDLKLAHTNDATAFSERPLIGIIENYQNADGTVTIPEVLRKYMGNKEVI